MAHVDNDSLIGVPFRQAATVIGVAEQRLRRWNAIGLVLPSIVGSVGSRHYWSYGLEDIVQGRVVRDLEDRGVHIRAIRRIVEAVRSATTPRPLAELTWGVADGEAFVQYPDGGWVGNRRPVQGVMVEVLNLELLGRPHEKRSCSAHNTSLANSRSAEARWAPSGASPVRGFL